MIIDFHAHTFPDRIASKAIAGIQQASQAAAFSDGTVSGLTASMSAAGIDRSVVLPVATNPAKLVSMNNAAIAQNGKDGLICFGAMHPLAEDWKQELDRLARSGIQGIKLHPLYQGVDIDDIRYLRILGRASELGLITITHAGNDIAYPGQIRCSPPMIANALHQVGNIPLVLAHMGGWKNWDAVAEHLADTGVYLDTAISLGAITPIDGHNYRESDLPLLSAEAFCKLVDRFGSHRILFGTDSPWADQKQALQAIRSLPLTESQQEDILFRNAQGLLSL
ncbi:MAG: amidohydrolase family protein [Oscillospiraceae bacterium]|nr:amidohydrolase family protein [Oscillospiraceae bacterium]